MDSNAEEPYTPSAFDLPTGSLSEKVAFPARPLHVLLITTGSVASIKAPLIVDALLDYANVQVQVAATTPSLAFYDKEAITTAAKARKYNVRVWTDDDEWKSWKKVGDPILHIELRRWADLVLIAPLDANTLAKLSHGLCDNLVTSLMRALDSSCTKVCIFPAMNTFMYNHPLTKPQLDILGNTLGYEVVGPVGKELACGDVGIGAMTDWKDIVKLVVERYSLTRASEAKSG